MGSPIMMYFVFLCSFSDLLSIPLIPSPFQERKPVTRNSRKRKATEPKAARTAKSPTKQSNKKRRIIKDDDDDCDAEQLHDADNDDDGSKKTHNAAAVSLVC